MSDADDQMGGTGGENGRLPQQAVPGQDNAAPAAPPSDRSDDQATDETGTDHEPASTEESFPASDPPANY